MFQERVPRNLRARTGKHLCIRCLAETPDEAYFRNDHVCDACAALEESVEETGQHEESAPDK